MKVFNLFKFKSKNKVVNNKKETTPVVPTPFKLQWRKDLPTYNDAPPTEEELVEAFGLVQNSLLEDRWKHTEFAPVIMREFASVIMRKEVAEVLKLRLEEENNNNNNLIVELFPTGPDSSYNEINYCEDRRLIMAKDESTFNYAYGKATNW